MTEGGREREERNSFFTASSAGARETILCSSTTPRGDTGGSEKSLHQSAQNNVLPLLCLQGLSQFPHLCGEDAHFKNGLVFIFSGMRLVWVHNVFKLCLYRAFPSLSIY